MEAQTLGHDMVDDSENIACASLLEIFSKLGGEITGDFVGR